MSRKQCDVFVGTKIVFTGSDVRVYAWLKDMMAVELPNQYEVMEHGTSVRTSASAFVQAFEQISKTNEPQFVVFFGADLGKTPIFEGAREAVAAWLDERVKVAAWRVYDRVNRRSYESREFIAINRPGGGDYVLMDYRSHGAIVFRGTREAVYEYLLEHNELDAPSYIVLHCETMEPTEEGDFIRQFEEYLSQNPEPEHKCLTEEDVRRVAREEIANYVKKERKSWGA